MGRRSRFRSHRVVAVAVGGVPVAVSVAVGGVPVAVSVAVGGAGVSVSVGESVGGEVTVR